jgi:pRiA4b ORF-3-like protein/uncharacterized protein DUF6933
MILRLSQKLAKKVKAGTLSSLPPDDNPYADWSANLFTASRTQYILLTNTQSLYSVVMYGKGITDDTDFISRALENLREFMEDDGQSFAYQRFIAPATGSVSFAKALNRSVTGSMNDMIVHAKHWLTEGDLSPFDVGFKLNQIPMSALKGPKSERYGIPREVFKLLSDRSGSDKGVEEARKSAGSSEFSRESESPSVRGETEAHTTLGPTINVNFTYAQRKAIAEILPNMADRLKLDEKNARTITFTSDELETIRQRAKEAIPNAENGMKRNSLEHLIEGMTKAIEGSRGIGSIPKSERLYQFKITLLESEPRIWRRIQIKNGTLDKLHEHIQTAMGWTNSHLHQFHIGDERYGDPELLQDCYFEDFLCVDSTMTKISEILPKSGERSQFVYEYDFGDDWQHEVLFEGCLRAKKGDRYPLCVEGERACPPEDVGGIRCYAEFLVALAAPEHERHDEYMEWSGPFDSEKFDAKKATKRMRRGLPDWRQYE